MRIRRRRKICAVALLLVALSPLRAQLPGAINLDGPWQMKDYTLGIGAREGVMLPGRQPADCLTARVPCTVRTALLEAGQIPDPYSGYDNEKSLWVEEKEWWFFKSFDMPAPAKGKWIDIVFEGTSFRGEVYVNGVRAGDLDGMLNPRSFDVTSLLKYGSQNVVAVRLEATPDARMNVTARGLTWDSPRDQLYSIAQCMYGWDWGPHGVPVGIWRPVWLRVSGPLHIDHPYVRSRIEPGHDARCTITLDARNVSSGAVEGTVSGLIADESSGAVAGQFSEKISLAAGESKTVEFELNVHNPKLWWPNGMGAQDLYLLRAAGITGGDTSESLSTAFALRELKLTENENVGEFLKSMKNQVGSQYQLGKVVGSYPWTFQVNGRKMFAKGGNWIPVDQLLRLDRRRYDRLLSLARDAHFNLLRVWGGGLYETDDFYNLCDRYGILAWQEFLSNRSFSKIDRANFLEGARAAVYRLRNHPSLTFWCGGNEFDPDDAGSKAVIDSLGALLSALDPSREFHRASPYKGDDHYWGVWHGLQPYTAYRVVRPFRSEAGVNTFPVPEDYAKFTPPALLWPMDTTYVEYHGEYNTRFEHLRKLSRYADEFGPSTSIGSEIMKSELYQAIANSFNMEFCREHKFQNSGVLIWQYNDIWPCISWSVVDWYGTPKPSYYFMKRASRPVHIAADYAKYLWKPGETFTSDLFLLNDTDSLVSGAYRARVFDDSGHVLTEVHGLAQARGNRSARVGILRYSIPAGMSGKSFFVAAELMDMKRNLISDAIYPIAVSRAEGYEGIFQSMEEMPRAPLSVAAGSVSMTSGGTRTVSLDIANGGSEIAYFVRVRLIGESPSLVTSYSDNYISLLPGEKKTISASVESFAPGTPTGALDFEISGWNTPPQTVNLK